jgi:DNA-binding MarR family transcriptional regulator
MTSRKTIIRSSYEAAARLRVAERTFARHTQTVTARHHLTPQRYVLLLLIRVAQDGGVPATVTSLVGSLQTTQSSVTQLVTGAERAGLIRRKSDARDARRQHLFLTRLGAARLARAFADLGEDRLALVEAVGAALDAPHAR